ncbi:hypothetical protein ETD83_22315 [Actinomadura soli]|uniref:Uncharacterized protein n=1 Tax=Actinomadura soli TaxID=2508997 RepID=A0A5C4JAQ2_9ACTN|nr:hypothetical protein [Actinomadura soli]TMQ95556.1 hypothetical protein ETD83_22315 [Actinomadura soli]
MNRSARSLLSVSVLAPVVAAFAVAAAPANAAPGAATTLLYEAAAVGGPVTGALPEPVTQTAGQTAEMTTGAVDGVIEAAPTSPRLRSASAKRCKLNPGKTVNSHAGTNLPNTPLSIGKTPLGGLPKGDCLPAGRRAATEPLPTQGDPLTRVPKALVKDAEKVGTALRHSRLGGLPGVDRVLPGSGRAVLPAALPDGRSAALSDAAAHSDGRRAAVPSGQRAAMATGVPSALGSEPAPGLPNLPLSLGSTRPGGLPVGTTLFPAAGRYARPAPSDDLIGQANDAVNQIGGEIDKTENGVGSVVEVLKARDGAAKRTAADGPLSMPDASGIGLGKTPGIGLPKVPGLG